MEMMARCGVSVNPEGNVSNGSGLGCGASPSVSCSFLVRSSTRIERLASSKCFTKVFLFLFCEAKQCVTKIKLGCRKPLFSPKY